MKPCQALCSARFANMVRATMALTFIHTADWHIGKAFGRFESELAAGLRAARLAAIDRIAAHAKEHNASHVLVAGDIWDHDMPSDQILNWTLERLAQDKAITWWLLPGNHDPARPNGLWQRLGRSHMPLPANVRPLLSSEPVEIEHQVYVLPSPLTSKDPGRDLTQWMDDCVTPEGAIRIGLAHGSTQGFGSETEASSVLNENRAQRARLDYLALGDWHGKKQINNRTWYAGTPEPDQFPRNDPGWCLGVTINSAGAEPEVTPLPTATYSWISEDVAVSTGMTPGDILSAATGSGKGAQKTMVELTLTGRIGVQDATALQVEVKKRRAAFAYFEVRQDKLQTMIDSADLDRLDHAGSLRKAAEDLIAQRDDAVRSPEQHQDARQALSFLFTMALAEGGSGS